MSDVPLRPSDRFDRARDALDWACRGCPMEGGWLDHAARGEPACANMLAIRDDERGSLVLRNGVPACPKRPRPGTAKGPVPREEGGQMTLFGEDGQG